MKTTKFLKEVLFIFLFSIIFYSCSKDDGDNGSNDKFAGIPSGEIVSLELRDETLIGYNESGRTTNDNQRWWKQEISKINYECEGYEDEDYSQENVYYAFKPDGIIYYKLGLDGQENFANYWEWENDNKNAIISQGVTFELRELNPTNLVYASYQEESSNCYAITWEKFSN